VQEVAEAQRPLSAPLLLSLALLRLAQRVRPHESRPARES
jgi:hypothetical protein